MTILDLACFDDLDDLAAEIEDPLVSLEQDNYHRLITPQGQNIDDPNFGLGLPQMLSGSTEDISSLPSRIEAELLKDPRNAEVRALITPLANPGEYDIAIAIRPDPDELGTTESDLLMRLRATPNGVELV